MESNKRVLIIDANQDFRTFLVKELETQSDIVIVGTAADGYDALDRIVELSPDVILMDIVLPKLDGLGVMKTINRLKLETEPVIIILSNFITDLLEMHAASLGADYFFVKPFEIETLMDVLRFSPTEERHAGPVHDTQVRITEMLHEVGVPSHIKGFYYLREGICMALTNQPAIGVITTRLYPTIAKKFGTTPSRVERAIRHAIEVAWDRSDFEVKNEIFRNTVNSERGKPTNAEFIAMIADRLQLQTVGSTIRI